MDDKILVAALYTVLQDLRPLIFNAIGLTQRPSDTKICMTALNLVAEGPKLAYN
jgi:hypothetical protein